MGKWLVKSDPETYSFDDLKRDGRTVWDGVRNAQAHIHLRAMKAGDPVMVYHSNTDKAVMGLAEVVRAAYPDSTDKAGKSVCVDLAYKSTAAKPATLAAMKAEPKLAEIGLIRQSRLSVMPVTEEQWKVLMGMMKG